MKFTQSSILEWFLRLSLSAGFLSAVADRFGFWKKEVSVWGNWDSFLAYTKTLMPLAPNWAIPVLGGVATALEVMFGIALLTTIKTSLVARASGLLLVTFGLTMTFSVGFKAPLDYSVYTAAAAAFALSLMTDSRKRRRY